MIQSMTGYGKAELNLSNTNFSIEIKSLNSKQIDINMKIPSEFRGNEIELRNIISEKLKRGKIGVFIWKEKLQEDIKHKINTQVIKKYHQQIIQLQNDLKLENSSDTIHTLLKMPNAIELAVEQTNKDEWVEVKKGIDEAVENLLHFRIEEGKKLSADISIRIHKLGKFLNKITPFEKTRLEKIKKKLKEKLSEIDKEHINKDRFEQELIYYLEKQDITEEKVRLNAHLSYFTESMSGKSPVGKKLLFIAQEIGREINTIGSKSSNAEMQKIVVQMKDELEKVKEQLLNIL